MLIRQTLCLGAALVALPAPATAQTPASSGTPGAVLHLTPFQVTTTTDRGYLAANSVSATRLDTPIKDLPFAVNAFTQQFIADLGARDLWDVVQYAPAVTSAGREFTAGNSVYTIRGFEQKPQRNGFAGDAYVDTVAIERVEVVKGPASVLYGQVAPGGTVNYLTKRAQPKAFATLGVRAGNDAAARTTLDLNQPLAGGTVLMRVNAAWENLGQHWEPGRGRTWVVAPHLVWPAGPQAALSLDYQRFRRDEHPGVQLKPNTVIVAPPPVSGILSTTGVLAQPDNSDPGTGPYFPLPADFNYASRHDTRRSDFESWTAQLDLRLGAHWQARATADWNRSEVAQKLTGLAQISLTVPARYFPTGAATPPTSAEYAAAARAFAADLLTQPQLAREAPQAQQVRRQRFQEDRSRSQALQAELAGDYTFGRRARVRPMLGVFHGENTAGNFSRQSGGPGFPNFPVWDLLNPVTWDRTTDFAPLPLPLVADTRTVLTNDAVYAVFNASLFGDRVSAVGGLRHNQATGLTDNLLAPATSVPKVTNRRTTSQFGLGYRLYRALLLYGSYSESFVLNAANLQLLSVPAGPARPTVSSGGEIGFKADFLHGRVSSTVAFFQIEQTDRILRFITFGPTGLSLNNTLQGTLDRSRGVEAEITWSPYDHWQVYASGAVNDVRVLRVPSGEEVFLGTRPENTARVLANLWTRYTLTHGPAKGAWLGAGFNHTGRKAQRVNNPRLFLPAETLWNVTLGYDWKRGDREMTATLGVQNLTDREYYPANQQRGFPRRITVSLTFR